MTVPQSSFLDSFRINASEPLFKEYGYRSKRSVIEIEKVQKKPGPGACSLCPGVELTAVPAGAHTSGHPQPPAPITFVKLILSGALL